MTIKIYLGTSSDNKQSTEKLCLDRLLKKYKTKNRVSKTLGMEELFLAVLKLKHKISKDKLSKEYRKNSING